MYPWATEHGARMPSSFVSQAHHIIGEGYLKFLNLKIHFSLKHFPKPSISLGIWLIRLASFLTPSTAAGNQMLSDGCKYKNINKSQSSSSSLFPELQSCLCSCLLHMYTWVCHSYLKFIWKTKSSYFILLFSLPVSINVYPNTQEHLSLNIYSSTCKV